jgi:Tfp pilus assembly protein PilV
VSQSNRRSEQGFTLVESLIAVGLMAGSLIAIAGAIPLSALIHRSALEREQALSLAQFQMEYFLTNPGPMVGESGNQATFANAAKFPSGFAGSYSATRLPGSAGLTLITVDVIPPHTSRVELSAIDTTFTN